MLEPSNNGKEIYPSKIRCKFRRINPRYLRGGSIETVSFEPIQILSDLNSNNINEIDNIEDKINYSSFQIEHRRNFSDMTLKVVKELIKNKFIFLNMKNSNSKAQGNFLEKEELKQLYENNRQVESFDNYSALSYLPNRWIGKRVPYYISDNIKVIKGLNSILESTIIHFCKDSGMKFEKFLNEEQLNGYDYVYFDCESTLQIEKVQATVGRQPGKNVIIIHSKSSKPVLLHVLMHIIGFAHQQKDPNEIIYGSLCKTNLRNPDSIDSIQKDYVLFKVNFEGPYDKYSVMHIPACEDIKTCLDKKIIKGVKSLSDLDKKKIKYFYGDKKCTYDYFKSPYVQNHYNCKTCWDQTEIPICAFCAQYHHKGHNLVDVNYGASAKPIKCLCGIVGHVSNCSKSFKDKTTIEKIKCKTCSEYLKEDILVCFQCFKN